MSRARIVEWITLALMLAAFAAVPFTLADGYRGPVPNTALKIAIYVIMALGLNIVLGYTGQLDLGYVTFMATGMVVTAVALVAIRVPPEQLTELQADPVARQSLVDAGAFHIPIGGSAVPPDVTRPFQFDGSIVLIMLASGLVCALIGLLRGWPTLHLTGDYYAIVTLGVAEIIYLYYRATNWTGGAMSLSLTVEATPTLFGQKLYSDTAVFYYLVITVLVLTVVGSVFLRESRFGRALASIRLDPTAARTCGVEVERYKMIAFAASGFVGGVGGSLFCLLNGQFSAPAVEVWESILLVCMLVLGGMGSVRGVILGGAVLIATGEVFREPMPSFDFATHGADAVLDRAHWEPWPQQSRMLFYGMVLILLMRFRPKGVLPDRQAGDPLSAEQAAARKAAETPLFKIGTRGGAQ